MWVSIPRGKQVRERELCGAPPDLDYPHCAPKAALNLNGDH